MKTFILSKQYRVSAQFFGSTTAETSSLLNDPSFITENLPLNIKVMISQSECQYYKQTKYLSNLLACPLVYLDISSYGASVCQHNMCCKKYNMKSEAQVEVN